MPGLGTIINTAAIVVGGLLGLLFKNLLTKSMEDTLLKASSVCVLFIGIGGAMQHMLKITDGALETSGSMMLIICFVLGSIVGELLDIEGAFERFGAWLRKKTHNESDTGFLSAFIHASLTVCIGAMAIVGSIQDGLLGDSSLLCAKAALDAIAGHYQHIAESQNTKVFWRLELPERLPIDEVDLCMMLGNLMENALHAVCALPIDAREVTVISSMISGAMLGLSVENSYVGDIVFGRNGLPITRKRGHGIGLPSVAATVKRYNGTLSVTAKDGVFGVNILLSL